MHNGAMVLALLTRVTFVAAVALLTDSHNPGGCLVVQGALACGEAAEPVRRELAAVRAAGLDLIRKRLERARRDGDLPEGVDCADLARYLTTVVHGLTVQAAGGATRKQLERVAQIGHAGVAGVSTAAGTSADDQPAYRPCRPPQGAVSPHFFAPRKEIRYFWRPTRGDDGPPFYAWFIKREPGGARTHHIHMVEAGFREH